MPAKQSKFKYKLEVHKEILELFLFQAAPNGVVPELNNVSTIGNVNILSCLSVNQE